LRRSIRLAYLVSQYPATNHTFILREIRRLRDLGIEIHATSIRGADRPSDMLTKEELDEAQQTYYVIPAGFLAAARDQLLTLLSSPAGFLRGLVHALRLGGSPFKNGSYFVEAIMIGRWMKRKDLSHVHTHFSSTVALIAQRTFPIRISITIHGPDEFNDAAGFHIADKVAAAQFVCAISHFGCSQLMRFSDPRYWDKIEVARLGVDPAVFLPKPFREYPDVFEIICVGRLAPAKAQHILIEAIALLVAEGRSVLLRLVGDGPDRASLEHAVVGRKLEGHVRFEGWLNQDRVLSLYEGADIFALASFAEGVPVVLMEAMAMEIPCVATWITGIPELIRSGVDGVLVPPSDASALAEAIASLMDDPGLRSRIAKAGRQRVLDKFNLETNVRLLADIFERRIL
jgi:glycosyltransferase involved in cell wall biosynthesis